MKRLMIALVIVFGIQAAYADNTNTANIKINIAGASANNHYFLCLPNVGCLSIHAATSQKKIYPVYHSIEMSGIYVMDTNTGYRVYAQGLPKSCTATIKRNHTITISGKIAKTRGIVLIQQLRCSIS